MKLMQMSAGQWELLLMGLVVVGFVGCAVAFYTGRNKVGKYNLYNDLKECSKLGGERIK
jgi:hypothetical protein